MELLPDSEVIGLLALMLLQESRRTARTSSTGDLILLEDQDRSLWNQAQISEGRLLVQQSLSSGRFGSYTLQAAISAVHSEAPECCCNGLGADCGLIRPARAIRAVARCCLKSGGGSGNARWPLSGTAIDRPNISAWRFGRLPSGTLRASRFVSAAGQNG